MPRAEFSRKVKAAAYLRAGGKCEICRAYLKVGEGDCDHILPCELGGEPTLENCQVICPACHKSKTGHDTNRIRKADRIRDKRSGAMKSRNPLMGSKGTPFRKRMNGQVERRDTDGR